MAWQGTDHVYAACSSTEHKLKKNFNQQLTSEVLINLYLLVAFVHIVDKNYCFATDHVQVKQHINHDDLVYCLHLLGKKRILYFLLSKQLHFFAWKKKNSKSYTG